MDPRLKQRAFRVGCAVWVVLAAVFWIWIWRSGSDFFASGSSNLELPEDPANLDLVIAEDLRVSGVAFGVLLGDPPLFVESDTVPLEPGIDFGWVAWLDTPRQEIGFREIFQSASPDNWTVEDDGSYSLSEDRTTMTRELRSPVWNGVIYHFWEIADGDLPGAHRTWVLIEGEAVADFSFEVE